LPVLYGRNLIAVIMYGKLGRYFRTSSSSVYPSIFSILMGKIAIFPLKFQKQMGKMNLLIYVFILDSY